MYPKRMVVIYPPFQPFRLRAYDAFPLILLFDRMNVVAAAALEKVDF
jgi:hypothetical protein